MFFIIFEEIRLVGLLTNTMRITTLVLCITSLFAWNEATKGRKCFAPVYCDHGDSTGRREWLQVFPPPKRHWTQSGNQTHKANKKVKSGTRITDAIKKDVEEQKVTTAKLNEKYEELTLNDQNQVAKTNDLNEKYGELASDVTFNKEKYEELATDLTLSKEKIKDLTTKLNATEEQLINMNERNNALEMEFRRLTEEKEIASRNFEEKLDKLKATVEEICNGVFYQGLCYFAIIHASEDMNYNEAVKNCRAKSSKPADILDSAHYNMIFEYVRSLTSSSYRLLWLGTTINPRTKVVSLSNGNRASYVKYYSGGYPSSTSTYTQMAIDVKQDSSSTSQGMWNYYPTFDLHGVLCQK